MKHRNTFLHEVFNHSKNLKNSTDCLAQRLVRSCSSDSGHRALNLLTNRQSVNEIHYYVEQQTEQDFTVFCSSNFLLSAVLTALHDKYKQLLGL